MVKPLARFRVYPWNGSLYYLVTVFGSRRAMYAYCKSDACKAQMRGFNYEAIVHSYDAVNVYANGRRKIKPILGEMHFLKDRLTMNIVTHESMHAALGWYRRRHADEMPGVELRLQRMPREEELCYAAGHIGASIVDRCERAGFL